MRFRALLLVGLAAGALAVACGKDETKPPTGTIGNDPTDTSHGGGGSTTNTTSDAGAFDGGACSTVQIGTASVQQQTINDTLPVGTGGTIVNGVYDLVTDDKYVGLSGVALTEVDTTSTIAIAATAFQRAETRTSAGVTTGPTYASGTFNVSGANGVIALACPLVTSTSITYTMQSDGVTLVLYDTSANEGRTYRLR